MLFDIMLYIGLYVLCGLVMGVLYVFLTGETDPEDGTKVIFLWPVVIAAFVAAGVHVLVMSIGLLLRKLLKQ